MLPGLQSLIARTRSHLFKYVSFCEPSKLKAWEGCFPDPKKTPAIFTTHLAFCCQPSAIPSWIRSTFINVVMLGVGALAETWDNQDAFAPFHNLLPPHVKSLSVGWRGRYMGSQEVFDFICSFPSLEDLDFAGGIEDLDISRGSGLVGTAGGPLPLPKLTGTISLTPLKGELIRQFLELSGDLHFRKIVFSLVDSDICGSPNELVERCSGTLECIVIRTLGDAPSKSRPHSPAHNRICFLR